MTLFVLILLSFCTSVVVAQSEPERDKTDTSLRKYLLRAKTDGIISKQQFLELQDLAAKLDLRLDDARDDVVLTEPPKDTKPGAFMKLYNRLTLLNVLYFGGGLLVMGSATLFMTLAWEKLSGITLFLIIGTMSSSAGGVGVLLWNNEEYQVAGGL